jgi:hypothetical protein
VQLFHHTYTGGFILVPLETRKSNTSNQHETRNANGNSVKQIVIGQRALESSKWKLEDG